MASRSGDRDASDYMGDYYAGVLWRAIATKGLDANHFQVGPSELRGYAWKLFYEPTGQALHASSTYEDSTRRWADLLRTEPDGDPVAVEGASAVDYIGFVRDWADQLKAAKSAGQLRGGAPTPIASADSQADQDNAPFSPAERAEIIQQLRSIRDSVRANFRLSAKQLATIDKRLEEAEEASKRLGRKDWKSMFYGIIFGLMVNDAIPPDVAQHIFIGVAHGIAHLFGGGLPPGPWMLSQ